MARSTAVLISGSGTNLQALIDARLASTRIALVVSDRADAYGLQRAARAGIPHEVVAPSTSREDFESDLDRLLRAHGIELVCLAGFMRILPPWLVERWRDRILNIHPSLLPAFRGLHTHRRALEAGVRFHGCTVHVVRPELDQGPIVVQAVVPVQQDDDEATLAARVLAAEHRCYPLALDLLASGRARVLDERVVIDGAETPTTTLISPVR